MSSDNNHPILTIIGAGGIGIDMAHYLTAKTPFSGDVPDYLQGHGILDSNEALEVRKPKNAKLQYCSVPLKK